MTADPTPRKEGLTTSPAHRPVKWYEECQQHPIPNDDDLSDEAGRFWDEHFYVGEDGLLTCEASYVGEACAACTEERAQEHATYDPVMWPCKAVSDAA